MNATSIAAIRSNSNCSLFRRRIIRTRQVLGPEMVLPRLRISPRLEHPPPWWRSVLQLPQEVGRHAGLVRGRERGHPAPLPTLPDERLQPLRPGDRLAVLAWAPARIVTPPPAEGTVIRPATGGWVFPDERDQSRHGWRSGPRSRLAGAGRLGSGARLAQLGPQPRGLGPEILPLLVRGLEGVQPALGLLELSLQGVLVPCLDLLGEHGHRILEPLRGLQVQGPEGAHQASSSATATWTTSASRGTSPRRAARKSISTRTTSAKPK